MEEIIYCGIENAETQKTLVEAQETLLDSQTSILQVQQTQMEYQHHIAGLTKFLYGLSAYNMASVQSVLINLEAVLSKTSKEKLGETAKQQLNLAMEQLKNQKNLLSCIKENKDLIYDLNQKQDMKIEKLLQRTNEQDRLLQNLIELDRKKDELLIAHCEKLSGHDKSFEGQKSKIDEIKEEISNKDKEINYKLMDLKDRIEKLYIITSKLCWKIVISAVAIGSLILCILQICNIF